MGDDKTLKDDFVLGGQTIQVDSRDEAGDIMFGLSTNLPTASDGFAAGARLRVTSENAVYQNIGDSSTSNWELVDGATQETELQFVDVTITRAEILALNTTPKTIVPAAGAGLAVVVDSIQMFNDYNTVAFAFSGDLEFRYTDGSGAKAAESAPEVAFCEASADAYYLSRGANTSPVVNAPVVAYAATADPTAPVANGEFKARVYYRVMPLLS